MKLVAVVVTTLALAGRIFGNAAFSVFIFISLRSRLCIVIIMCKRQETWAPLFIKTRQMGADLFLLANKRSDVIESSTIFKKPHKL